MPVFIDSLLPILLLPSAAAAATTVITIAEHFLVDRGKWEREELEAETL